MRAFFAWLTKQNHLPFNPAAEIDLPKQPKTLPKAILSADEVERILAEARYQHTARTSRSRHPGNVLLDRHPSSRNVSPAHRRHPSRSSVAVRQSGQRKEGPLHPDRPAGLVWIARYVESGRDSLLLDEKEQTLFVTNQGEPLHPDSLTEYARRYIQAAGIGKPGACHIFRHTMATLMLENGADLRYLQAILGHEKLDTTQIYTRTSLRKLLEVHGATHPAERPDESPEK